MPAEVTSARQSRRSGRSKLNVAVKRSCCGR
jgi:hypothetical protein